VRGAGGSDGRALFCRICLIRGDDAHRNDRHRLRNAAAGTEASAGGLGRGFLRTGTTGTALTAAAPDEAEADADATGARSVEAPAGPAALPPPRWARVCSAVVKPPRLWPTTAATGLRVPIPERRHSCTAVFQRRAARQLIRV
jgi:hypothetical protein